MRTRFAAGLAVVTALMLQVTLLDRLGLWGTAPGLLLVVVVGFALAEGPLFGCVLGFCAGLLADVVPPADHPLGWLALGFCLAGYIAGNFADPSRRSAFTPMVVVALAAILTTFEYAVVGLLLGDSRISAYAMSRVLPASVLYDVLLTPFVIPLIGVLARRLRADSRRR